MHSNGVPEPIVITRQAALSRLVSEFAREKLLAVDTEANSLHAYQEHVCLIQFSTARNDYLVDPLAIEDLSPLSEIFANPAIEKIFHAAEYDLIILKRDFNFQFQNIFDTMVAARILGWKAVGLGSILKAKFNVKVNKKFQRADWGQRPLNTQMLHYAQLDTRYLIALRELQKAELVASGRWPIAVEDFERATQVRLPDERDHVNCWRVNGSRELEPAQMGILQELCAYRDRVAQALDRPLFKVMNDQTLVALAETCPQTLHELIAVKGISQNQARRHGDEILEAIGRGLQKPCPPPPQRQRPDDTYLNCYDALRTWRKKAAHRMGVESDVVLPKDLLIQLAAQRPENWPVLAEILASVPWRLEHFGEQILTVIHPFT
ncbi:MAG: HRDC domain-containing protein [Anaerolineales bacterium]|nr:HRDC domain-containing protein [Anaerolineales bacterium]